MYSNSILSPPLTHGDLSQTACNDFSFGTDNKHSENFVNYYLKHRSDIVDDNNEIKMDEKFINLLKENKIFYPIPKKKIHIPGAFSERK